MASELGASAAFALSLLKPLRRKQALGHAQREQQSNCSGTEVPALRWLNKATALRRVCIKNACQATCLAGLERTGQVARGQRCSGSDTGGLSGVVSRQRQGVDVTRLARIAGQAADQILHIRRQARYRLRNGRGWQRAERLATAAATGEHGRRKCGGQKQFQFGFHGVSFSGDYFTPVVPGSGVLRYGNVA